MSNVCRLCGWDSSIKQILDTDDNYLVCEKVINNNIKMMTHKSYCLEDVKTRQAVKDSYLFNPRGIAKP